MGLVFAIGVVSSGLASYPGGWAADRFSRRPVMVVSMALFGLFYLGYLLPVPVVLLLAVRAVHTFFGGAYRPAAAAMVADLVPPSERGRAFGLLRAADMSGILIGPVLGGLLATIRLDLVFYAGAFLCLGSAAVLLRLPRAPRQAVSASPPVPEHPLAVVRLLGPVLLLALPIQWVIGDYDTIWSLFMNSVGATKLQIGLSFAVYAVPIIALSGFLGGIGDRLGHRRAALASVVTYGVVNAIYPFVRNVWVLVGLGFFEGGLTAAGQPALSAEVSRRAGPDQQGRVQGVYGACQMAAEASGALAGGLLLNFGAVWAFGAAAAVCVACAAVSLGWGRGGRSDRRGIGNL